MIRPSAAIVLLFITFIGNISARPSTRAADLTHQPPDLKLSGELNVANKNHMATVNYAELLRLPQEQFTVSDDSNFTHTVRMSGVDLDLLLRAYAASGDKILIAALCDDGYEAHYTAEYRAAHHPFLVLRIDGHAPADLPRTSDGGSFGPYLISHKQFVPSFRILSHEDEPQIPNGLVELRFFLEGDVLRAIQAPGRVHRTKPCRLRRSSPCKTACNAITGTGLAAQNRI